MADHDPAGLSARQPWLHLLDVCVDGNVTALSGSDGQVCRSGAQGFFIDDRRILSLLTMQLGDEQTVSVASSSVGSCSEFFGSARHLGDPGPDPTVEVLRRREAVGGGVRESITVTSRAADEVHTELIVALAGDGAPISAVKAGTAGLGVIAATAHGATLSWQDEWHEVLIDFSAVPTSLIPATSGEPSAARFAVTITPGGSATISLFVHVVRRRETNLDANSHSLSPFWADVSAVATDIRLAPALDKGLLDLQHLLLTDPADARDSFAAAGTPWYLTLFGRDSLWAARMVLPFGTELAAGTLRSLARRQGTLTDDIRAESPGKIPHEIRRSPYGDPTSGLSLPSSYYGTIDATALWITVLREAWTWGMPRDQVAALLPNLLAAVTWLTERAAPDEDGLLKYIDLTGTGLANQGWKDSGDSIRWRDGRIAVGPIALIEVQGYAVEAARAAAELYDIFRVPGAERLREWADSLALQIHRRFWVGNGGDSYLGIAVDGAGATVDGVASNMGHVLGTGALSPAEAASVTGRLVSPPMLGSHGIATLARDNGGFNPMGYHTGSIWTHDTAICAWGMAREGHSREAGLVARTLLASAEAFDYRWPELYAGDAVLDKPAPYPASCRPQAWSAASAALLIAIALGFTPDASQRRLTLRPASPAPYGAMTVTGLRFLGQSFGVEVDEYGITKILDAPADVDIVVVQPG